MSYYIAVMDYSDASIRMFSLDEKPEEPEEWLEENDPNWSDSQCYWMGSDHPIDVQFA